jgi:chemotaxis protein MotB
MNIGKIRMLALLGGVTFVWFAASGCVNRDEYLRVDYARRKAVERADAMERDLEDARMKAMALEKERESMKLELDQKTALVSTLEAENKRLDGLNRQLLAQLDQAGKLGEVKVVEVKLPPEIDKALKEFAAQYPDAVEYDPLKGAVRWKSDLTFALGSDVVRDSVKPSLKAFADIVDSPAAASLELVIVGHTDNVRISPNTAKKFPTNWHLSAHRSVAVAFVLQQFGVAFERIGVMGYGEYRPRVPNPPSGGCETNRRVEIFLVTRTEQPTDMGAAGGSYTPARPEKAAPDRSKAKTPATPAGKTKANAAAEPDDPEA